MTFSLDFLDHKNIFFLTVGHTCGSEQFNTEIAWIWNPNEESKWARTSDPGLKQTIFIRSILFVFKKINWDFSYFFNIIIICLSNRKFSFRSSLYVPLPWFSFGSHSSLMLVEPEIKKQFWSSKPNYHFVFLPEGPHIMRIWDLKKIGLRKICVNGTVLKTQLTQISQLICTWTKKFVSGGSLILSIREQLGGQSAKFHETLNFNNCTHAIKTGSWFETKVCD